MVLGLLPKNLAISLMAIFALNNFSIVNLSSKESCLYLFFIFDSYLIANATILPVLVQRWGGSYNIAGYAFLLCLIGHIVGIRPKYFAHTLVDAHVYTAKPDGSMAEYDHIPGLREQLERVPSPRPRLVIDPSIRSLGDVDRVIRANTSEMLRVFRIEGYKPAATIRFKVAM